MEILIIGAVAIVAIFGIHSQTTATQVGGTQSPTQVGGGTNSAIQPPPLMTAEQVAKMEISGAPTVAGDATSDIRRPVTRPGIRPQKFGGEMGTRMRYAKHS